MRIKRFQSIALNGYLDFELRLNDGPSFLIGINGSGKTTVLKAIMALISPDIDWIMSSSYTLVEVDIDNEGQPITIRSEAITGGKAISIVTNDTVLYQSTVTEEYYRNLLRHSRDYRYEEDGETVSIAETLAAFPSGMEALDFIKHLPTPIYLGLDRSTLPISLKSRRNRQVKRSRQPHATLRAFLDDSVGESEDAAVTAVRRAGSSRQNAAVDLRQKILLTLFLPASPGMTTKIPSAKEIRTYEQYRRSLKLAFKTLGLNNAEISAAIDPFFSKLIDVASQLKEVTDLSDIFKDENDHLWRAYREWGELAPRIPLFEQAEILVRRFNDTERLFRNGSVMRVDDRAPV